MMHFCYNSFAWLSLLTTFSWGQWVVQSWSELLGCDGKKERGKMIWEMPLLRHCGSSVWKWFTCELEKTLFRGGGGFEKPDKGRKIIFQNQARRGSEMPLQSWELWEDLTVNRTCSLETGTFSLVALSYLSAQWEPLISFVPLERGLE